MIDDNKKENIIKEFRKTLLDLEKENLSQLHPKGDSVMTENLKSEFEKVVKKYEDN